MQDDSATQSVATTNINRLARMLLPNVRDQPRDEWRSQTEKCLAIALCCSNWFDRVGVRGRALLIQDEAAFHREITGDIFCAQRYPNIKTRFSLSAELRDGPFAELITSASLKNKDLVACIGCVGKWSNDQRSATRAERGRSSGCG